MNTENIENILGIVVAVLIFTTYFGILAKMFFIAYKLNNKETEKDEYKS